MSSEASIAVKRLTLHVPAMSAAEAEALAHEVGQALRRWPATPAAAGRLESVKANVGAAKPGDTSSLADRIASAICESTLRELSA